MNLARLHCHQLQQEFEGWCRTRAHDLPAGANKVLPPCVEVGPQDLRRIAIPKLRHDYKGLVPKKDRDQKLLVLDLDQTLVTSREVGSSITKTSPGQGAGATDACADNLPTPSAMVQCGTTQKNVWFRPGLKTFLEECTARFQVVIYTGSGALHCQPIVQEITKLSPKIDIGTVICGQENLLAVHYKAPVSYTRGSAEYTTLTTLSKDLRILGRPLSRIIFVDDMAKFQAYFMRNSILIKPFWGHPDDCELEKLLGFLKELAQDGVSDVRRLIEGRNGHEGEQAGGRRVRGPYLHACQAGGALCNSNCSERHKKYEGPKSGAVGKRGGASSRPADQQKGVPSWNSSVECAVYSWSSSLECAVHRQATSLECAECGAYSWSSNLECGAYSRRSRYECAAYSRSSSFKCAAYSQSRSSRMCSAQLEQ
eukprot:jgi/Botrbrau1/15148/Bobra.0149s0017.1